MEGVGLLFTYFTYIYTILKMQSWSSFDGVSLFYIIMLTVYSSYNGGLSCGVFPILHTCILYSIWNLGDPLMGGFPYYNNLGVHFTEIFPVFTYMNTIFKVQYLGLI